MHRAFSLFTVKAVNEAKRIITGIATTPEVDRQGDVIDSLGVTYKNPLPFLWQHDTRKPIGTVKFNQPTKDGITFEANLPEVPEPGVLRDRIEEAWQSIRTGLVRAVSIGFRPIEYSHIENGGIHFTSVEVMELSAVTIPAQASAVITDAKSLDRAAIEIIKQFDTDLLAATGHKQSDDDRPNPAGASATKHNPVVKAQEAKTMSKKTIAEQIASFETTGVSKTARMTEIMDGAAEKGETLNAEQEQEYDTLATEVKSVNAHLVRLREHERTNIAKATAVEDVGDASRASDVRAGSNGNGHSVISVKANVPLGTAFSRFVWASVAAEIKRTSPIELAKQWRDQTPEVEKALIAKAAVAAGTTTNTTWAAPLVELTNMTNEFAELLRPATIIGRIPGLRRVPFNIKVPRETTGASVNWVGEGGVKPVGAMAFDQVSLLFTKVAGIVPVTEELFRFSSPAVEEIIRNSLRDAIAYLTDRDFLDPAKAEVVGVSPASITNGVTAIPSTGTTADAMRADLGTLLAEYAEANMGLSGLVLVMTSVQAMRLALMRNTLGNREFEGLGLEGGKLEGIPVIVSENIVGTGGSPIDGGLIVAINASEILIADDGDVTIDLSREASLQMDGAPDSPETASTVMVSLWQRNMVALRAERFINWKKRRAEAVQFIQYAKYA